MTQVDSSSSAWTTTADLRDWVLEHLHLDHESVGELLRRIDEVVARQRQLVEASKQDAIRALSEGFAAKMNPLRHQLAGKELTVSEKARY